jgi:DNA-binding response OmpR family regulator
VKKKQEAHLTTRSEMAGSVLIIGGEPDFREGLNSSLAEAGYEVTTAHDYIAGRMIIEDLVPDIIILDETHPNGNDSFTVCQHLYDDYDIPIVVLGKGPNGEMWKKTVDAGGEYYCKMPCSHQVFISIVKSILRRYKGRTLREPV